MSNQNTFRNEWMDSSALGVIDKCVAFIEMLLTRDEYEFSGEERNRIKAELMFVRRKREDKYLNLSVVGEASSGKSTFINSLLRESVLESANLLGTTVASTIIRYGSKRDVIVHFKNGKTESFREGLRNTRGEANLAGLKEYVRNLTANRTVASQVKEVIVEHPAEVLKSGITIIDTPGLNANAWDTEETQRALKEISDVSVILTTADQPMPGTLCDFIQSQMTDVLGHCIFVVTKMDNKHESEREALLTGISNRVSSLLGLKDPTVLPHTPMLVLGEADKEYGEEYPYDMDDRGRLLEQSYRTERTIYQTLGPKRIAIQVQKLSYALQQMLSSLKPRIKEHRDDFEKRRNALEKLRKPELGGFIKGIADESLELFDTGYSKLVEEFSKVFGSTVDSQIQSIADKFSALPDHNSLEAFCKSKLQSVLSDNATKLVKETQTNFRQLVNLATTIMEQFGVKFSKKYHELERLSLKSVNIKFNFNNYQIGNIQFDHNALNKAFSDIDSQIAGTTLGGAAAGALIGSIVPGIGTIIGGVIGGIWGALSGTDLGEHKEKVWHQQIAPIIDQCYERVANSIDHEIQQHYENLYNHIVDQLNDCYDKYHQLIDSMIEENERGQRQLRGYMDTADRDIRDIEANQRVLNALRA